MAFNLIRKEFLLTRKSIGIFWGLCVLSPLMMILVLGESTQPDRIAPLVFLYMAVMANLSFMQTAATEEEKNPKATALLCAAPYSRKSYVVSKYICFLIFCCGCIATYTITSMLFPRLHSLSVTEALIAFFLGTFLYSVFTPVALKYGMAKARIVFTVSILAISLGPTIMVRLFHPDINYVLTLLQNPPALLTPVIFGVIGIVIFLLSMAISIRIFSKKEL